MGHVVEIMIVALIGLAIFGPKALQGLAREAGKTAGQAKTLKEKFTKDISAVTDQLPQVPTNPQQALEMLMNSGKKEERQNAAPKETSGNPTAEVVSPSMHEKEADKAEGR